MVLKAVLAAAAIAGLAATGVQAQESAGRQEYMIACAGCHGESAKGTGPIAGLLKIKTPDLTKMTARNGGKFPFEYAVWMIDGRKLIRTHGTADMPVWGDRFMASANKAESATEIPETRELIVRGRILSLVMYLESIQQK